MSKKTAIKARRRGRLMENVQKESPLARKARKLFPDPEPRILVFQDDNFGFIDEPRVVQSYTTYSLGDTPILDFGPPRK
jgi:hypothetical protein